MLLAGASTGNLKPQRTRIVYAKFLAPTKHNFSVKKKKKEAIVVQISILLFIFSDNWYKYCPSLWRFG
jgi:hypothetical protein